MALLSRRAEFAEESAEVEVLFAQAKRHEELDKKLAASQKRIQESGSTLSALMGPVYTETQAFKATNRNVDRILETLQRLKRPMEGKEEEERIIHDDPARVGIQRYIASMRRIEAYYSQLINNPLRVNQDTARDLGKLLREGAGKLQELFKNILQQDVQPVEPLSYMAKKIPFPTLPETKTKDLAALDAFVASTQPRNISQTTTPTLQMYTEIRGRYLDETLRTVATASISTAKKRNPDEIYRKNTCAISHYARAIEGSFVAEWQNIRVVFGGTDTKTALDLITRPALSEFARTLRELNTQIKASITTDCFLAYEILDVVNMLAYRMDERTGQLKQQIMDTVRPVRDTAKSSLKDLIEDIRRKIGSMIQLPQDGSALPYTTETMIRLQFMVGYPQPLASIMTSVGDGGWSSTSSMNTGSTTSLNSTKHFDVSPDGKAVIAHYVYDTIDNLLTNLETKGRLLLKSKAILGLFMANNVAVIDRMIRTSDLQKVLASYTDKTKLDTYRKKSTEEYLDQWRKLSVPIMDIQQNRSGARPPSGTVGHVDSTGIVKNLSSKEKDAVKQNFTTFNTKFDELSASHKALIRGMEKEIKSATARGIRGYLEPLYGRYWDKYHEIDKGKGKYVKWDKAAFSAQLNSFE